jgi:hypothetical protein
VILRPVILGLVGLGLLMAGPSAGQSYPPSTVGADVDRLQRVLAHEQEAEFLYLLASGSGRVRSSYATFVDIHAQHLESVQTLTAAITSRGASPVAARSFNDYVDDLHTMEAGSEQDLIDLARAFERRGAAEAGALGPQFLDPALGRLSTGLAADDEARWHRLEHAITG